MTALDWLLAEIAVLRRTDPWGNRDHWEGGKCLHQGCAVYRAADAVRAEGVPVPAELGESVCRWEVTKDRTLYILACGGYWRAKDGMPEGVTKTVIFCPSCGGRIEVTDD